MGQSGPKPSRLAALNSKSERRGVTASHVSVRPPTRRARIQRKGLPSGVVYGFSRSSTKKSGLVAQYVGWLFCTCWLLLTRCR
jgi:hypothetical protein